MLTEFVGAVLLAVDAGLVDEVVASGWKLLDAVIDGAVVGTVVVAFDVGVAVVTFEVAATTGDVELEVSTSVVGVAEVAVPAGVGVAELLFANTGCEEGQGSKGVPSLVRFRLWWIGLPESARQMPYLADLPKVLWTTGAEAAEDPTRPVLSRPLTVATASVAAIAVPRRTTCADLAACLGRDLLALGPDLLACIAPPSPSQTTSARPRTVRPKPCRRQRMRSNRYFRRESSPR
jgi:hypothetical protein